MSFPATRSSLCTNCFDGIKVGDIIERNTLTRGWQHVECPPEKPREVCPVCFLEKANNGACGCAT